MNKDATTITLGDAQATCDGIELRLRVKAPVEQWYEHTTPLANAALNDAAPEMARLLLDLLPEDGETIDDMGQALCDRRKVIADALRKAGVLP